jgi:DeoR/GlpR family transcriptional regulator of sugar metabolism
MDARKQILDLLEQSRTPLTSKSIAFQLGKRSDNIRKLLSNLASEGRITRVDYGLYDSVSKSVNVNVHSSESVNPELIRRAKNQYNRIWRQKNPGKQQEYLDRYWMKKAKEYNIS